MKFICDIKGCVPCDIEDLPEGECILDPHCWARGQCKPHEPILDNHCTYCGKDLGG